MNKMNSFIKIILLYFLLINSVKAQLASKIDHLLNDKILASAEVGICVLDSKGELLYGRNNKRNFIPASLQKIITNFTALEVLGENYQFSTEIGYTGTILPDGNLIGDIVIYGNGDPSFGSERFQKRPQIATIVQEIVKFIKNKGITCIDGYIISDASYYGTDGTIHSWAWNDLGNYYACNTWSINIHENYYNLYFNLQTSLQKQPKIIGLSPYIPNLTFKNELVSGPANSGDESYIFGSPYTYNRIVRGSLPIGSGDYKIKGSIPDSPLFFAQLVSQELTKNRISNSGAKVEYDQSIKMNEIVLKIKSPMLKDLVQSANLESINLYCESFLTALGKGNRNKGIKETKKFLANNQIDTSGIFIEDGSGLSFWNNISPDNFAHLLLKLNTKYGNKLQFYFPKAGVSGTLSYLFKDKEANGKLWAKTGSMQQVMNYAGFTIGKSGKLTTFCIIINRHMAPNKDIRKIEEEIMNIIYLNT